MKKAKIEKQNEHKSRNCLFCSIQRKLDNQEAYRTLKVRHPDVCFALLDKSPKTLGHVLVISKNPFNDITDTISDVSEDEKRVLLGDAIELAKKLERVLGAEKVYFMSMCEHWNMWETDNGITTEHFHIHLVPRYLGMRDKNTAGELLLLRSGKEQSEDDLKRITQLLNEA